MREQQNEGKKFAVAKEEEQSNRMAEDLAGQRERGASEEEIESAEKDAEYTHNGGVKFSIVTDKGEVDRLEKEDYIEAYHAMQKITMEDGKTYLFPPMAAVQGGEYVEGIPVNEDGTITPTWEKADENPDLAFRMTAGKKGKAIPADAELEERMVNGNTEYYYNGEKVKTTKDGNVAWYFSLKKGNSGDSGKKLTDLDHVAYDPYQHSGETMLNDQFTTAYDRSHLVIVKVRIPKSEAEGTSEYKADKAALGVGKHDWKGGKLNIKGGRQVILSRWDKPVEIMSDDAVAADIKKALDENGLTEVPFNIVTPSQRDALVRLGVKIGEPTKDNAGQSKECKAAYQEFLNDYDVNNGKLFAEQKSSNIAFSHAKIDLEEAELYDKENGTEFSRFAQFLDNGRKLSKGEKNYFVIGKTGELLNRYGMFGNISIKTSTVNPNRHSSKGIYAGSKDWYNVINSVNSPIAITETEDKYRLYLNTEIDGKKVCVLMETVKAGRDIEISNIKTLFPREISKIIDSIREKLLYPSMEKLKQAIESSSQGHNRRASILSPVSGDKDTNNYSTPQEDVVKITNNNEIIPTEEVDKGIYINVANQDYIEQILNGDKTIETRFEIKGKDGKGPLDSLVGKRVALISTGNGKQKVMGYVTVNMYTNRKSSHTDGSEWSIPEESPTTFKKVSPTDEELSANKNTNNSSTVQENVVKIANNSEVIPTEEVDKGIYINVANQDYIEQILNGVKDLSNDDFVKLLGRAQRLKSTSRKKGNKDYNDAAGEVESRNVESRLGMTPEQRRNTLASETEDVSRDKQIVLFDTDEQSAKKPPRYINSQLSLTEKGKLRKFVVENFEHAGFDAIEFDNFIYVIDHNNNEGILNGEGYDGVGAYYRLNTAGLSKETINEILENINGNKNKVNIGTIGRYLGEIRNPSNQDRADSILYDVKEVRGNSGRTQPNNVVLHEEAASRGRTDEHGFDNAGKNGGRKSEYSLTSPEETPYETEGNSGHTIRNSHIGANGSKTFSHITPEQDKDYLDAVEKGDTKAAELMVRDAAAKAMPEITVPRCIYRLADAYLLPYLASNASTTLRSLVSSISRAFSLIDAGTP